MHNKNPLVPFLVKMTELMDLIRNHKGPISTLPPHLQEQLTALAKDVSNIDKQVQQELDRLKIDPQLLQAEVMHSKQTPSKDKEAFKNASSLRQEAEALSKELKKSRQANKKASDPSTKKSSSLKRATQRRRHFKSLGEDKSWISL